MEYKQWIKILRAVNADGDLDQDNIIEKIRKELKAADLVVYEKWREASFSINHFFYYYCSSNSYYEPLLKLAIQIDCVKIVEVLIDKGVGVNSLLNRNEDTPLSLAYFWSHAEIIKVLIDKGADVDTSGNGRRLLVQAAKHGYIDILNILIDKGVDVNIDTFDMRLGKCTPLILAAEYGHGGVVKALIDNGADVDRAVPDLYKASGKWTLLLWAAENGYIDIVEALINKGADVNKASEVGRWTPLRWAVGEYKIDVCESMVNHITKLEADGLYVSPENLKLKAEIMPKIERRIFLYNHKPLINILPLMVYHWGDTLDGIKAFLEENRDRLKVKLGVHEKSLIDFVDFEDVAVRHISKLGLCAAVSAVIRNNAPNRNLGNPSTKQLRAVGQSCSSSVDEQVSQPVSETTGTIKHISASDSEHGEVSESDSTKILVSNQVSNTQNNNQRPSPRNEERNKLPIVVASTLAVAGIISGIAIAVYLEMLAVGIAVGACCLVAAAIIYYCNEPSNSLKNSNVQGFSGNREQLAL
ncbi:MAG: ankyrin repeat domain-containing protein [Rickettsiales bacterium]|jgi:ankyrin repeat protein|nr:ankyrin repeat domain-containing protein [Rickettsiales bacterium]